MKEKNYIWIALFIGMQACLIQVIDQVLCAYVAPTGNFGFGWIAFQAWAMYFLSGCNVKGAAKSTIGYFIGIVASIAIITMAGKLGVLGFWATPITLLILVPIVMHVDQGPELIAYSAAVFVGAGAYFGFMTYVPGATFGGALVTEMIYCILGLFFGFMTVTFMTWYKGKYVNKKDDKSISG